MRSVLLGVMRLLMNLWCSTEFSFKPFSIQNVRKLTRDFKISPLYLQHDILGQCSPTECFFKASEYRDLLLFYGPIVFRGILESVYYNHFLLLSEAVFILLMESISVEQVDHAEKLLWNFCSQFGDLYGERYKLQMFTFLFT